MKRIGLRWWALLVLGVVASVHGAEPLGTRFTYQGRLTFHGVEVSGNYDLRFTLYDTSDPAVTQAVAGPTTNAPVFIDNGLFTTALDFGALPFGVGTRYWIEIGARSSTGGSADFAPLTPRQPLSPTPQALFASEAEVATIFSGALAGDVTGTQGATVVSRIGTLTPDALATVANAANAATGPGPGGGHAVFPPAQA